MPQNPIQYPSGRGKEQSISSQQLSVVRELFTVNTQIKQIIGQGIELRSNFGKLETFNPNQEVRRDLPDREQYQRHYSRIAMTYNLVLAEELEVMDQYLATGGLIEQFLEQELRNKGEELKELARQNMQDIESAKASLASPAFRKRLDPQTVTNTEIYIMQLERAGNGGDALVTAGYELLREEAEQAAAKRTSVQVTEVTQEGTPLVKTIAKKRQEYSSESRNIRFEVFTALSGVLKPKEGQKIPEIELQKDVIGKIMATGTPDALQRVKSGQTTEFEEVKRMLFSPGGILYELQRQMRSKGDELPQIQRIFLENIKHYEGETPEDNVSDFRRLLIIWMDEKWEQEKATRETLQKAAVPSDPSNPTQTSISKEGVKIQRTREEKQVEVLAAEVKAAMNTALAVFVRDPDVPANLEYDILTQGQIRAAHANRILPKSNIGFIKEMTGKYGISRQPSNVVGEAFLLNYREVVTIAYLLTKKTGNITVTLTNYERKNLAESIKNAIYTRTEELKKITSNNGRGEQRR